MSHKIMITILMMTLMILIPVCAAAQEKPFLSDVRMDLGMFGRDYKWTEYGDDGPKVLEETGYLGGVSGNFESLQNRIGWRTGADVFFGKVHYDGQTWTGEPVTTNVLYAGAGLFCDVVPWYRFTFGLLLKPFAGIGGEFWIRDLDDTKTSDGEVVRGAEEWWGCVYGRVGLCIEYPVTKEIVIFSENGIKIPIYARNEANFLVSGSPRAGLEPEQDVSDFASAGVRWKQWGAKISYDTLRFDRSKAVSSGTYNLYQPDSKADVYNVEVFWSKTF